jgi:uncharacterized protein
VPAQLVIGEVQHTRSRPTAHGFRYPIFNVRLPLDDLTDVDAVLPIDRWGWVSFFTNDHGARDGSPLLDWAHAQLREAGVEGVTRIELVCLPRILGYVFNPVSFWLCWTRDGQLRALIAEVNNTFGERLSYVLTSPDGAPIRAGQTLACQKRLHVSPFNEVVGGYQFRCFVSDTHFMVRIDYDDAQFANAPLLATHVSGACVPLTTPALRAVVWKLPWLTVQVVAKIHWQALKLIVKRVRFFGYLPSEGKR